SLMRRCWRRWLAGVRERCTSRGLTTWGFARAGPALGQGPGLRWGKGRAGLCAVRVPWPPRAEQACQAEGMQQRVVTQGVWLCWWSVAAWLFYQLGGEELQCGAAPGEQLCRDRRPGQHCQGRGFSRGLQRDVAD